MSFTDVFGDIWGGGGPVVPPPPPNPAVPIHEEWLSEVESSLLSGDRDERNVLTSAPGPNDRTLTFAYDLNGIAAGSYLGIDLEVMYVIDVNDSALTATVVRGQLNSPAQTHLSGSTVYVNPRFTRWQMFNQLNAELRDLSAPPNSIYRIRTLTLTTAPTFMTYTIANDDYGLPVVEDDILNILEVRHAIPDALRSWPRITRNEYSLIRNLSPITFPPSGLALRLDRHAYPGQPLVMSFSAPLVELSATSSSGSVFSDTGIPRTAWDIPPLGAAARLMGVREAKRSFVESEGDSRRAQEVPSGAAARAAAAMLSMLNQRIRSEAMRLQARYPETV